MAFQSCPDIVQIEFRLTLIDQLIENVLHARLRSGTPTVDSVTAVAAAALTWWEDHYSAVLSTNVKFREVFVKGLETATDPQVVVSDTTTTQGQLGVGTMPNNVTFAVKFTTGRSGRSTRGRAFVPGLPDSQVGDNLLSQSRADSYVDAFQEFLNAMDTADADWIVLSRVHDGAPRATGVGYVITTVGYSDLIVDSSRRRLPGRGA